MYAEFFFVRSIVGPNRETTYNNKKCIKNCAQVKERKIRRDRFELAMMIEIFINIKIDWLFRDPVRLMRFSWFFSLLFSHFIALEFSNWAKLLKTWRQRRSLSDIYKNMMFFPPLARRYLLLYKLLTIKSNQTINLWKRNKQTSNLRDHKKREKKTIAVAVAKAALNSSITLLHVLPRFMKKCCVCFFNFIHRHRIIYNFNGIMGLLPWIGLLLYLKKNLNDRQTETSQMWNGNWMIQSAQECVRVCV